MKPIIHIAQRIVIVATVLLVTPTLQSEEARNLSKSIYGADWTHIPGTADPDACDTIARRQNHRDVRGCGSWAYFTEDPNPDACLTIARRSNPRQDVCGRWYEPYIAKQVAVPPPAKPQVIVLHGITFDFDKSEIRSESIPVLEKNVDVLERYGTFPIVIVGHTDSIGTDAYNQKLSERRAQAVKSYFVSQGIAENRMTTEGRGESEPIESNGTKDGRYQNRRIEIKLP